MLKLLHTKIWSLFIIVAIISVFGQEAIAQGCNGADGTGIFIGSIANRDNGTICANNPIQPALMEIDISNIVEPGTVQFEINWDDGSAPQRVNGVKIGANRFFASVTHLFPPNGGQVKCEYRPNVRLVFNNVLCAATLGTPPRFVRWNTDDQQTGDLSLLETVTGVNEYLVCAGVATNVTFTDRSDLNCVPPDLILGQNDRRRWRQFVYGTANTITGAVRIAGAVIPFPANGAVSISGEPVINSGFPTTTTSIITVPATAQVGEIFEITMNYWNTCNAFPGRPPVIERARIRIVAQPPAPTSTNQTVCNGTTPSNFALAGVPPTNIVNWYRNVPGSPDTPGTLITSGTSTNLNFTPGNVPGYTNNTTAGVYSVWASYRPNIANGLNCESPKIQITRTIRNALTVPNPTTAPPADICNGGSFNIVLPNPATETFGGTTQYVFNGATGVTIGSSNANSATYNTAVTFAPGELFVDRTISVQRRYTTAPNCGNTRNFTVRIYNPTVGGTPSPFPDVCEGTSIGPITLSGHIGNIVGWQIETNGGGFVAYAGPASGNSITPGALPDGVYRFRAVVDNGPCNVVQSAIETVTVTDNPTPPTAGTDQAFCGSLVSAPQNATLPIGTGTWTYVSSIPLGRPAPTFTANNPNTTFTIANATRAGAYIMKWSVVIGSCTFEDDVEIDFGANPDPVPAMAVNPCGETSSLTAPIPSIGSGVWTIISGPGGCVTGTCPQLTIDDINSPTSGISLNAPFTYGAYILEWRVTSGICPPAFGNATVTFYQAATATASDINGICLDPTSTAIPLTGTFGGGASSGDWQNVDGNGSPTSVPSGVNPVNDIYTSNAADYTAGLPIKVKLRAIPPGASSCPIVEQEITINVDRTPVANAGATPLDVCESFIQLNAQNPPPFGATGLWTGTAGLTFDNATDPQTIVRNLPAPGNSVTVRWTLTSAGGNACTDFDEVIINRITAPNATDIDPLLCEILPAGGPLTTNVLLTDYEAAVTSIPVANRTITWYQDGPPPLGTLVVDPSIAFLNVPDGKVYLARIFETATGCTSDAFVTINIKALPTAQDGTVALCEDTPGSNTTTNVDLIGDTRFRDAVTTPGNVISWHEFLPDAQNNVTPITTVPTVTGTKDVFARVTHSSGLACPTVVRLILQVNLLPSNVPINGDPTVCMGSLGQPLNTLPVQTYQVASVPGARYYWTIPTGPGQFNLFAGGGLNDFYVLLQFPYNAAPPIETLRVRIELNGCSSSDLLLPISRSPQPVLPDIDGASVVCSNDNGVHFEIAPATVNPSSDYSWEIRRQSDNSLGGAFITSGQTLPDIFVEFGDEDVIISVTEVNNVCSSPQADYPVAVNRRPIMLDNDPQVCSDSPTNIIFLADALSPVPIDKFTISNAIYTAGLGFKVPAGPETFPQTNLPANFIENHVFENLTPSPLVVNYTVTPISEGTILAPLDCPGTAQIITINVKPEPQLSPNLNKQICSGVETGITLLSANNTFPADRFIINSITVPAGVTALTPPPVADGVTLYLDNILYNNTWENTTGANQIVRYEILPYSTTLGCVGNPATTLDVTIYPRTDVNIVPNQVLCNGDLLNLAFSSTNNPDANFLWRVTGMDPDISLGSPAAGSGNIANMIITNTSSTLDRTVSFEVRGKNLPAEEGITECLNPTLTFTVLIRKSPEAHVRVLETCSDLPGGSTFTADLASLEPSITPGAGDPDYMIKWYETQAPDGTLSSEILTLNAYVMTHDVAVYVEVEYLPTNCKKVVPFKYLINPNIGIVTPPVQVDLKCNNDGSGEITLNVTTGTPGYSYSIDGGPSINTMASIYTFKNLTAGLHSVRVEDVNNCSVTTPITLVEPLPLTAAVAVAQPVSCFLGNDGSVQATFTGGTTPIASYLLLQTNTIDPNNDGLFLNLRSGSYSVRIEDANGCTTDALPVPLDEPTQVSLTASVVAELGCKDATDGRIDVSAAGGNGGTGYTYTLIRSGDPVNPFRVVSGLGALFFDNLPFGSYTITARDQNNCPSPTISLVISNPPIFIPGRIGDDQSICLGASPGLIDVVAPAFGGLGNFAYEWDQSLTGLAADWVEIPGATGDTFLPGALSDTTYYRRRVSSGSCPELTSNVVQIKVNPLPDVVFTAPIDACQGDPITLNLNMTPGTGTAPIEYDYQAGSTTFTNLIGTANTSIPISNFQENTTYTLLRVRDLNGCLAPNVPQAQTVSLIKINPDFEVLAPTAQCPGGTFNFQWVVEPGVMYRWEWTDGTQTIINNPNSAGPDDRVPGTQTISHVFAGGSTEDSTIYPVRLWAQNALCDPKSATKIVTVFPNIILNILPGDLVLCSGETTRFRDQSVGVDAGTWYYRVKGTTDRLEEQAGPVPILEYQLFNITTSNPIIHEVIYEATNDEGCTAQYMQEIKVYRGVTASIVASPDPQNDFIGGVSTVTFINNSNPLDAGDFDYLWDFDDIKASPPTGSGTGNIVVDYFSADSRNVTLKAINRAARDIDGKTCESVDIKPIMIHLPLLEARFRATPLASCFPTTITVQNLSPGADTFAWEVFNQSGLVATSNLANPEFRILAPGTYDIFLKASYLATGQTSEAKQLGIEVFDKPSSLFEMRPNPLYVPDTELQTFNKSLRANVYEWNFDDGGTSTEFEPRYFYKLEGKYKVMLVAGFDNGSKDIDGDGILDGNVICYDTTRQDLVALDGGYIKLPNAFTPSPVGSSGGVSGNGTFNDVFLPIMRGVEEFQMQIFDRWGTLIFQSKDKDIGWDGYDRNGTAMPAGVYVYKLVMRLSDGQRTTKIGDVTLIK